ncbi:restriction endonuclease subunit S [Bifidobacterium adolescentis]|nr:restriction endonuclease subunit S [Bifidobacterium adolescentis]KAB5758144.1 restriction endonuclease subunit S [Bifidobacterium adolescentis]KAB5769361.1 restriction endonuclease subunit S [Bifidobacterium adolescentis]KAB5780719.1 restriction endonuclease subunit S [Bifidobacterium adolescentis]KAB5785976.1 restriction endonuclease subunit S [Bifidobacterium adolescentis]
MAEQHGKALVPQIRFAGFTDPWEQRKLGEVATFGGGHTPSMSDSDNYEGGNVLWVTSQDVKSHYLDGTTTQITEKGAKELTLYPAGSLVMVTRSGILRHTLPVAELRKPSTVNQDIRVILPQENYYGQWLLQFFISRNKELLLEFGKTGTTVESVDFSKMRDMVLLTPSLPEQQQIGRYFARLDNLITLHQRKYDKLCVLKKSMLDKMFPKGGSLYPEIRFAGFTDPWEQRKLGEVARRVTRKNENRDSDLPLTISAQYGLVDQRTFFNNQVASKDMSGYFLLRKGEFAYNKSTSTDSPWGAIKRLEKYDMGCVSTLYICFELLSGDPDFLVTYYETDRWYKAVQLIAAEGARNHGLLNIAPDDFFETQICIPKRIDEQRQIGAFFDRLDSLITLHQRKLELLRNIKKSMLDKMFV